MFQIHGDTCHLCGHPGATVADHIKPLRTHPHLVADVDNMRPAHGTKNQRGPGGILFDARCEDCIKEGKKGTCNGTRGAKPLEEPEYVPPILLDGSDRGWRQGEVYAPAISL
jgi:hypothetical protein